MLGEARRRRRRRSRERARSCTSQRHPGPGYRCPAARSRFHAHDPRSRDPRRNDRRRHRARAAFAADVAIDGDRIVEVGDGRPTAADATIDADGAFVTPGFVDIHTHLDAQLAWDPDATSSCWHGVTSVVLGNCGVTFAPVRAGQERWLAELMESVEDIPAAASSRVSRGTGRPTASTSRAIDRMPKGVNVGGMVGHCAVRHYAMGERGLDEAPATDDDIAAMADLVDEAMARGRARLLDVAHAAAPRPRRPPRARHVGRRARAARDRRRARPARQGRVRGRAALRAPGRRLRGHARRDALDGRDQPAHRPAGHVRARAEQRRPRAVPQDPRARRRGSREPAASSDRRRRRAASACSSACSTARSSTARRRGPRCSRSPSTRRLAALDDADRRAELARAPPTRTRRRSTGTASTCSTPDRVDYSADPDDLARGARASAHGETIAEAFVRISLRDRRPGAVQLSRSSTSAWTRSRSCSTTRAWRSASATPARTSASSWTRRSRPGSSLHWVRDRAKYTIEDAHPPPHLRHRRRCSASPTAACSRPGAFADVNVIDLDALALPTPRVRARLPGRRRPLRAAVERLSLHDRQRRGVRRGRRPQGVHAGVTLRS